MIRSRCQKVGEIVFPFWGDFPNCKNTPFKIEGLFGVPPRLKIYVHLMVAHLENKTGMGWLTVDAKRLKAGEVHRFPGPHVNGGRVPPITMADGHYEPEKGERYAAEPGPGGGVILASSVSACRGWVGDFVGYPDSRSNCDHIILDEGFELKSNSIYYGNSTFIHESLPVGGDVDRILFRITLPTERPYLITEEQER